jgi:hypothetical protein
MDKLSRRSLLRTLAGGALTAAGTVVLARTSLASLPEDPKPADLDVQTRAAELDVQGFGPAGEAQAQFLNFPGAGWGNGGGWRNLPWGNGFRNVVPWRNGGWRNGGWRNGGFRNGGFRNW